MLNPQVCQQARLSRDVRFDGKFFTAVITTGIFCRPTCPARAPKEENVRYFDNAAQAQQAGFQPCKRCLPELAPQTKAPPQIAQLASALELGAKLSELSERFQLSERHIRRLFQQHFGLSPNSYVQHQRLLLARNLLRTTSLPVADICFAAGFNSLRRFNEAIAEHYQCPPSALRKKQNIETSDSVSINLPYRPPYDWPLMLKFFQLRQLSSTEQVTEQQYCRTIVIDNEPGWIQVRQHETLPALVLTVKLANYRQLGQVINNVRRMFDLDADIELIHQQLGTHAALAQVITQYPGLRLPGCWDLFEFSIRAILGQQITVKAATTLANRISERYGSTAPENPWQLTHCFPTLQQLANADFNDLGITNKRIETLQNWIAYFAEAQQKPDNPFLCYRNVAELQQQLVALKGIGPWTANYLAMRGLSDPDAFPSADLGIIKALSSNSAGKAPSNKEILAQAECWRPWRSYAAIYLWHSLGH